MFDRSDLFIDTLIRDRERWVVRFSREAMLLRASRPARPTSLRQRVGLGLIQAGRALLRHEPAYAAPGRRLA